MPSPNNNRLRDGIKILATIDIRHSFLATAQPGWFDRRGHTILIERAVDDVPLVGVMLRYPFTCPEDETATMWIQYWLANLDRNAELGNAFKANIQAIYGEMVRVGATRVWGLVPKDAPHFATLLDPIATAGKCAKIDGVAATSKETEDFSRGNFFFGDGAEVKNHVQAMT